MYRHNIITTINLILFQTIVQVVQTALIIHQGSSRQISDHPFEWSNFPSHLESFIEMYTNRGCPSS